MIEKEAKEKEATKEQNLVLEKEQKTSGNGAPVLGTAQSHKSTEKKGKPKEQVTIKYSRELVFPSGERALFLIYFNVDGVGSFQANFNSSQN